MLFIYIYFNLLLLFVLFVILDKWYSTCLLFLIWLLVSRTWLHNKSNFYKNSPTIPRYKNNELYQELKHGDIINNACFTSKNVMNKEFCKYFNYRFSHCALVIEENGQKYAIESIPVHKGFNTTSLKCKSEPYNSGNSWYIVKQPLIEFLTTYATQAYRILRNKNNPTITIPESLYHFKPIHFFGKKIYYCTKFIGDVLEANHIITPSTHHFAYQTNELIDKLHKAGYTESFLVIC